MPNIPSMSIGVAQHDLELEKQRMMAYGNETLFVSKDKNLHADVYMESDTEEIYMPDGGGRQFGKRKRVSTTTEDDSGIVGY